MTPQTAPRHPPGTPTPPAAPLTIAALITGPSHPFRLRVIRTPMNRQFWAPQGVY